LIARLYFSNKAVLNRKYHHRKININTATLDELKAHPYIKWGIANQL
jgi:DNA uptake protein ComE-like DNA-binding protein